MRIKEILPETEIARLYADDLNTCESLDDLRRVMNDWIELTPDSWNNVKYLRDSDFENLRRIMSILIQGMRVENKEIPDNFREILWPSVINLTKNFAIKSNSAQGYVLFRLERTGLVKNGGNRSAPRLYVTKLGNEYATKVLGIRVSYI